MGGTGRKVASSEANWSTSEINTRLKSKRFHALPQYPSMPRPMIFRIASR